MSQITADSPKFARFRGGLRGGAPPVFDVASGEWFSWGHSVTKTSDGKWLYEPTLYTFDRLEPFGISRYLPFPPFSAKSGRSGEGKIVVYPCGAIRLADAWAISYGLHDEWCEIVTIDAEAVDSLLVPWPDSVERPGTSTIQAGPQL